MGFATPCFNYLTKTNPIVKVASKTISNSSRYLEVYVVVVKIKGFYHLFQLSGKNKPYCEGCKQNH